MEQDPTKLSEEPIQSFYHDVYASSISDASERLKSQTDFSLSALKNLHLVNGGAIVGLLTFMGHSPDHYEKRAIWWALCWFSIGLALSLLAYFGAFCSQAAYMHVSYKRAWNAKLRVLGLPEQYEAMTDIRRGNCALYMAIGSATLSLSLFVIGAFVALSALSLPTSPTGASPKTPTPHCPQTRLPPAPS